jgi:hypothetical protein
VPISKSRGPKICRTKLEPNQLENLESKKTNLKCQNQYWKEEPINIHLNLASCAETPSPQRDMDFFALSIRSHSELSNTLDNIVFDFSFKQNQISSDIKVQKKPTFKLLGVYGCKPYS